MTINQTYSPNFGRLYSSATSVKAKEALTDCLDIVKARKKMIGKLDEMDYDVLVNMRDNASWNNKTPIAFAVEVCKKINPFSNKNYSELMQLNENYAATKAFLKDNEITKALNAFLDEIEQSLNLRNAG